MRVGSKESNPERENKKHSHRKKERKLMQKLKV